MGSVRFASYTCGAQKMTTTVFEGEKNKISFEKRCRQCFYLRDATEKMQSFMYGKKKKSSNLRLILLLMATVRGRKWFGGSGEQFYGKGTMPRASEPSNLPPRDASTCEVWCERFHLIFFRWKNFMSTKKRVIFLFFFSGVAFWTSCSPMYSGLYSTWRFSPEMHRESEWGAVLG